MERCLRSPLILSTVYNSSTFFLWCKCILYMFILFIVVHIVHVHIVYTGYNWTVHITHTVRIKFMAKHLAKWEFLNYIDTKSHLYTSASFEFYFHFIHEGPGQCTWHWNAKEARGMATTNSIAQSQMVVFNVSQRHCNGWRRGAWPSFCHVPAYMVKNASIYVQYSNTIFSHPIKKKNLNILPFLTQGRGNKLFSTLMADHILLFMATNPTAWGSSREKIRPLPWAWAACFWP